MAGMIRRRAGEGRMMFSFGLLFTQSAKLVPEVVAEYRVAAHPGSSGLRGRGGGVVGGAAPFDRGEEFVALQVVVLPAVLP
jgi:hypothetical protein